MYKKTLKKTLLVQALSAALGATALTAGISTTAWAQSNTTATVYGDVANSAGTSVVIENTQTGLKRTATPSAAGRFQVTALPPGAYKVQLVRGGTVAGTRNVELLAGVGTEVNFVAQTVESVQVTARRQTIDVSNTTNGATFTAKELEKLPIARSVEAIVQLAPNTTRADSRYAAGASFAGGGASENAYYINGFPVTNPLTQLGASELPFGGIGQAQVLVGGFGAEFGRSVGGVVNITTKSGTNEWEGGVLLSTAPNDFRAKAKNGYYPVTGAPINAATDGTLLFDRSHNSRTTTNEGAYMGGPLIKDKLFMFLAYERIDSKFSGVSGSTAASSNLTSGWLEQTDKTQRYLAKIDWNITNDHRIEYTGIGDKAESKVRYFGYDYATGWHSPVQASLSTYKNSALNTPTVGSDVNIIKYTGNFTDDLTLTALYGQSKTPHSNQFEGVDLLNTRQVSAPVSARAPGLTYVNPVPLPFGTFADGAGAKDNVKSGRIDLEWKLGKHTIRAGLDDNKLESIDAGQAYVGGGLWTYAKTSTPNTPISLNGFRVAVASGGGLGTQGYYVREQIFNDLTTAYSNQTAQYIEDRWQLTKDMLMTLGLRDETYKNLNGDKVEFLTMKNQIAPRFGIAWDVNGDGTFKTFGSAGRYHLQIPTHIAVRGASRSTFTRQYFTYTGVDANGAPTGKVAITPITSSNNEFGQAKDARTVAALDMKPTFQDEMTLGFEKALNRSYNWGAKGTYRTLGSTIDDFCDQRPFDTFAAKNHIDTTNWGGFGCASFNPGKANTFLVDYAGTGTNLTRVNLSKEDLTFPTAKRTYSALDLFLEHPMRDQWYAKVNYTYSVNKGNTEGQTLSDVAQTDVAATQTWDTFEIMNYAYGNLPNDRKHQIKAYGFYEVTKEWGLGGNFLAAAGRPKNCIGNAPNLPADAPDYGSSYHYCNGVPSPRGTAGNLPWDVRFDINFSYQPAAAKGLLVKLDILNLFNRQVAQTVDEVYNSGSEVSPTYNRVISYTTPRTGRLTIQYDFKM